MRSGYTEIAKPDYIKSEINEKKKLACRRSNEPNVLN